MAGNKATGATLEKLIAGMPGQESRTAQASPFASAALPQSKVMDLLVELNGAITAHEEEQRGLVADLADVLDPVDSERIATGVAGTGSLSNRLRAAIDRLNGDTEALKQLRARLSDVKAE